MNIKIYKDNEDIIVDGQSSDVGYSNINNTIIIIDLDSNSEIHFDDSLDATFKDFNINGVTNKKNINNKIETFMLENNLSEDQIMEVLHWYFER